MNNNKYNISVVMATYNGEKYVKEQLESIINQTIIPNEIVISDDCSSDNTLGILYNFKNKYNNLLNIKILQNKFNQGYTKNFANALKNASGEIIFFSDQDDVWVNTKVEEHINKHFNNNAEFIASELVVFYNTFNPNKNIIKNKNYKIKKYKFNKLSKNSYHGMVISIVKNNEYDIICEALLHDEAFCHDRFLCIYYSLRNKAYHYLKPLSYYRVHNDNVAGVRDRIRGTIYDRINVTIKDYNLSKYIYELSKKHLVSIKDKTENKAYIKYIQFYKKRKEILENKLNNKYFIFTNIIDIIWVLINFYRYPFKVWGGGYLFFNKTIKKIGKMYILNCKICIFFTILFKFLI